MTQPDRPDLDWLWQLVEEVIVLAMDGHAEQVCDHLETIGQRGGHIGMFSACYAWASAAGVLSGMTEAVKDAGPDSIAAMMPLNGHIDETNPDTFAGRFLTCAINGDTATAHALFDASWHSDADERHQRDVLAVVAMVAQFGRLRKAEVAKERQQRRAHRPGRHRPRRPGRNR